MSTITADKEEPLVMPRRAAAAVVAVAAVVVAAGERTMLVLQAVLVAWPVQVRHSVDKSVT